MRDHHILVFYPLYPGQYITYFLGSPDGYARQYHFSQVCLPLRTDSYLLFVRFALAIFHYKVSSLGVSEPQDALPEIGKNQGSRKRKRKDNTASDEDTEDAEEQMDEGTSEGDVEDLGESEDDKSEDDKEDGPIAFKMLFKDAEGASKSKLKSSRLF